MKSVFLSRYTLRSAASLNARSGRTDHEGALIRVGDGFGCLHPWPELGDALLDEQLARLARGDVTALARQALRCAAIDGEARRANRNLFVDGAGDPVAIPPSHLLAAGNDSPTEAWEAGFRSVKHKIGPGLSALAERLAPWAEAGFRIRLDANESVSSGEWRRWWSGASAALRQAIEFIEDPCPWSESEWRALRAAGLPLAADRETETEARRSVAAVVVYKPAADGLGAGSSERERGSSERERAENAHVSPAPSARSRSQLRGSQLRGSLLPFEEALVREGRRVVVTAYMDHAIGQFWAAHRAAALAREAPERVRDCGLLTHRCFEPDPFFERIRSQGPHLQPPEGAGLGFDDLLEKLPWKRLT